MKKIFVRLLIGLLAVYAGWTAWQAASFKRYGSPAGAADLAGPPFEIEGVYHVHTRFSDGRKSPDQVAAAAEAAGLGFVILTDHGNPNNPSLDSEGFRSRVLVLAGSEISTNRGHLVAMGFKRPGRTTTFSRQAEAAAAEVAALGGITVIAHPYSKTRWSWGDAFVYEGIEILNGDSLIKDDLGRTFFNAPLFAVRPTAALLRLVNPPEDSTRKWDETLRRRPALGLFSSDAHVFYRAVFSVFHLHVLLDRPLPADFEAARSLIFSAISAGRFFSAVDGAASARGFRADLDGSTLRVATPYDFAHETVLIRDGKAVARAGGPGAEFSLDSPGAYRLEVHLRERTPLREGVPWIISNPFVVK